MAKKWSATLLLGASGDPSPCGRAAAPRYRARVSLGGEATLESPTVNHMNHPPTRRAAAVAAALAVVSAIGLSLVLVARLPLAQAQSAPGNAASEKPIRVLFLGDQGHHKPADRAAQLLPYLESRGIVARYTEDIGEINSDNLAKFDALLIYANIEQIAPPTEKAILDYVDQGGGLVPVHSASYCFLNSPRYLALVGARFKSHGGEV